MILILIQIVSNRLILYNATFVNQFFVYLLIFEYFFFITTVKPRFTANSDIPRPFSFPQIGLNTRYVNQTKPRFTADVSVSSVGSHVWGLRSLACD